MVKLGRINKLEVLREEDHGIYLKGDDEWDDILLPSKDAPRGLDLGEEVKVFVYKDSEDRIIGTTKKPFAMVGEYAVLEVASVEEFGIFLKWGLDRIYLFLLENSFLKWSLVRAMLFIFILIAVIVLLHLQG